MEGEVAVHKPVTLQHTGRGGTVPATSLVLCGKPEIWTIKPSQTLSDHPKPPRCEVRQPGAQPFVVAPVPWPPSGTSVIVRENPETSFKWKLLHFALRLEINVGLSIFIADLMGEVQRWQLSPGTVPASAVPTVSSACGPAPWE